MKITEGGREMKAYNQLGKVVGVLVCGSMDELLERLFSYDINYFELMIKENLRKHAIEVVRSEIANKTIPVNFIIDGKRRMGLKGFLSFLRKVDNRIDFPIELREVEYVENKNDIILIAMAFLLQYQFIYIHLSDSKPILIEKGEDRDIIDCISRYEASISFTDFFELERKLKAIIHNFTTIA